MCELVFFLVEEIECIFKDIMEIICLSDFMIYCCFWFFFVDRGFFYLFILVESLIFEVVKVEKKVYEKVICMIVYEVNNMIVGIIFIFDMVDGVLECMEDMEDLCEVMKVCIECCYSMSCFIMNFVNVVKIFEF